MVIEHAERMGLSQLHQLRGRVGRGAAKSACILIYQTPLSEMARARLKIIYESNDGFEIAQADLHLRGPGEFLGVRQSGAPMLKIADLERDAGLLEKAQQWADQLLQQNPSAAQKHLDRWLSRGEELVKV
jgi:ATP-dependent DNA helicase RecG